LRLKINKKSVLLLTFLQFSKADKLKIFGSILIQSFLSIIDLIGIGIIGVLGALAVTGIQSEQPGNKVGLVLRFFSLDGLSFQNQILFLGLIAAGVLVFRTIASIILLQKTLLFISRRGAVISSKLIKNLFSGSILNITKYSQQEILYATTSGVQLITLGILGNAITLIADVSLMVVMAVGLFIVDPFMSSFVFMTFAVIGFILYRAMKGKIQRIGIQEVQLSIQGNQIIMEFLDTFRELVVQNLRTSYLSRLTDLRFSLAKLQSQRTFLPNISKYVVESTVVIGSLFVCGAMFAFKDARHAVGGLAIFLAAGTRVAPAVLRIQQSAVTMKSSSSTLGRTIEMLTETHDQPELPVSKNSSLMNYEDMNPELRLIGVSFKYKDSQNFTLSDINLQIMPGEKLAIVGPSGAGKSTLVDLMLGILPPDSGLIKISGETPLEAFSKWNGSISYVPQNIAVVQGSIRENLALGIQNNVFSDEFYWNALEKAQLSKFVKDLPEKLDEEVGDQGSRLSGGQKQRLGIARALFTKPKMIIFDEATSSLDVDTENAIASFLNDPSNKSTIIMIAHRLSSVRMADRIIYLDRGKIVAEGNFETLRRLVPDFDRQANLLGL
jgi:ABC-type multidrug transport system fused ATPase/permease subunit